MESIRVLLDGAPVKYIPANLAGAHGNQEHDPSHSKTLKQNKELAFDGFYPVGKFYISGNLAREWLVKPLNPNGKSNSVVLRPHWNGEDLVGRSKDRWIIDFGLDTPVADAMMYEAPYLWVMEHVRPLREANKRKYRKENWWLFGERSPAVRRGLSLCQRYLATPKVSSHRLFRWLDHRITPNAKICAIFLEDDLFFGVCQSAFHVIWANAHSSRHGVGDDLTYNTTRTFETFPFPEGLTPDIAAADYADDPRAIRIAEAAARLNELRENWLNPADLVRRVPEVVAGYPDRILPVDERAEKILKKRTLTNLYNERPAWLDNAHRTLDAAVAAAYGWEADFEAGLLSDEEILKRLFDLNQARAKDQA